MPEFTWTCKTFDQLSRDELYEILRLRSAVFVVEQQCIYQDVDNFDQAAHHVIGLTRDDITCYARLLAPDTKYRTASIGRVVANRAKRRRGFGKELMSFAIQGARICGQGLESPFPLSSIWKVSISSLGLSRPAHRIWKTRSPTSKWCASELNQPAAEAQPPQTQQAPAYSALV